MGEESGLVQYQRPVKCAENAFWSVSKIWMSGSAKGAIWKAALATIKSVCFSATLEPGQVSITTFHICALYFLWDGVQLTETAFLWDL